MNRKERALRALHFEEPDRVPMTELGIDIPHIRSLLGEEFVDVTSAKFGTTDNRKTEMNLIENLIRCYRKLEFDVIFCDLSKPDGWKAKQNPDGSIVDEWGRILVFDSYCKTWVPNDGIFKDPDDIENFSFPDPHAPGRTFALETMKKMVRDEMAVAAWIRDPFAYVWEMFTPVNFVRWMYENPSVIIKTMERITDFFVEILNIYEDIGVDFVVAVGDYCEKKGPMVPTTFFREVIFPNLRRQVAAAHKSGLKVIKHTDGNINPILDDLANIVDGLHSLDPTAGVNIGEVKEKYGNRIVLMGNISTDSLARKAKEDVEEETKQCIRQASPGGGHFLTSSNTWYADAKLENCLAMVEAGRKYGKYPINIQ